MARKRKKKTKAQRRRIALRNLAKARKARKRGSRKSRRRSKASSRRRRRGGSRKRSVRRGGLRLSGAIARKQRRALVKRLEARGYEPRDAARIADRAMRIAKIRAAGAAKAAQVKAASAQAMHNVFAGFGAAGQLAAMAR